MLVIFLTMLVMLGTMVAAPAVRTERQREKEEEMIWRGKQYVRGIKLYYRKNGRISHFVGRSDQAQERLAALPAASLQRSHEQGRRFLAADLRQAERPTDREPETAANAAVRGRGPSSSGHAGRRRRLGQLGQQQQGATPGQPGQPTTGLAPIGTTPGAPGDPGTDQNTGAAPGDSGAFSTPNSLSPSDSPTSIIGGNIIGVGSRERNKPVIIYEKAKNYHLFEFIWDPSKDTMAIGGTGTQVGTPNAPGQGIGGPGQGFGQPAGQGPGQGFGGQGGFSTQPGNNPMQPTTPPLSNPPQQP